MNLGSTGSNHSGLFSLLGAGLDPISIIHPKSNEARVEPTISDVRWSGRRFWNSDASTKPTRTCWQIPNGVRELGRVGGDAKNGCG